MNKAVEEKSEGEEEIKQQDDIDSEKNQNQEQQQRLSLSSKAYKLFSERKNPLEIAIALNLRVRSN